MLEAFDEKDGLFQLVLRTARVGERQAHGQRRGADAFAPWVARLAARAADAVDGGGAAGAGGAADGGGGGGDGGAAEGGAAASSTTPGQRERRPLAARR